MTLHDQIGMLAMLGFVFLATIAMILFVEFIGWCERQIVALWRSLKR